MASRGILDLRRQTAPEIMTLVDALLKARLVLAGAGLEIKMKRKKIGSPMNHRPPIESIGSPDRQEMNESPRGIMIEPPVAG